MATARKGLGGWIGAGSRCRVYATSEAIEVDEHDGWHIARRRIFLDDVVLVTLHHRCSWIGFWGMLSVAATMAFIALAVSQQRDGGEAGLWIFLIAGMPFVLGALAFLRPFAVVSIIGRRTRTRLAFWLSHRRAGERHREICAMVAARSATQAPAPHPVESPLSA